MAKLVNKSKPTGSSKFMWMLEDQKAEAGTYPGIIVDCLEVKGVEKTFKDETQIRDITRFLVAYTDDEDVTQLAQTFEFNISGNENSNLVKFCANLRGKMIPLDGSYDQEDEVGTKCMVTIAERTSKEGKQYGFVKSLAPITKRLSGACPDFEETIQLIPGGWKYGAKQDQAGNEDDKKDELPPEKPKAKTAKESNDQEDPF